MGSDTKALFVIIGIVIVIFCGVGFGSSRMQSLDDVKEIGPAEYAHLEGLILSDPPLGIAVEQAFLSDGFVNKAEYRSIVARFGVDSAAYRARLAARNGIHKADLDNNVLYPNAEAE